MAITALPLFSSVAFAGPDLDAAAADICNCLEEPYKQITRSVALINKAQASGDTSQLMRAQEDVMESINAATPCFEALSKKYPEIDQSDALKESVMAIAEKQCPNPMPVNALNR